MEKAQIDDIRPPIVTLMGHIDHGKTTLLDAIRKTNVVAKEHGGITQHIGAYQVTFNNFPITFIDTPGHAAFEKMRSRGAEVADIIVLVVAANEGVKPQTVEAIKQIKKAKRPMIVAVTKIDLQNANPEKVKKQLQKEEVVVEQFGGDIPTVEVAATKGQGITDLLEVIQLVWQLSPEPSAVADPLETVVVESFLDKNRGPVATVIVKRGRLKVGQKLAFDGQSTTVRALFDERNRAVQEASSAKPVEVLGFKQILEVGTVIGDFTVLAKKAIAVPATLAEIIAKAESARNQFKVIIKADVLGSLEAICANLPEKIAPVTSGVGEVSLNDLTFAKVAHAPILAFNVKVAPQVKNQAEREGVVIKSYRVIYDLLNEMENVAKTFEVAKEEAKIVGRARIVATFEIDGQKIAGVRVIEGKIKLNDTILVKSGDQKKEAKVTSLKKMKKKVEVVLQGQECGIGLTPQVDFKVNDVIESLG